MNLTPQEKDEGKLETFISWLFIVGVAVSVVLEITGIILYYRDFGHIAISTDPANLIHSKNFFLFIWDQFRAGQGGIAERFMTVGIVVLILTPYLRVVISALFFAREKNWKYVVITCFVLVVLTVMLIRH